jgi:Holliday junction resolvase
MSRQRRGLEKEHEVSKNIFRITKGRIIPVRSSWSGNQAPPMPDLLIPMDGVLHAVEMKTTSQDTLRIYEENVEDLRWWTTMMTEVPTYPHLSIKFSRWQMCNVRLRHVSDWSRCVQNFVEDCPLDARVTSSGNLAIDKPEAGNDYWQASQSVDHSHPDALSLLEHLESQNTNPPSVSEIIRERPDFFENLGDS